MKVERNINLDVFRLLGLLIIMIAHARPPAWLFQLRNFGTPLLIVASALTYAYVFKNRQLRTKQFYIKRLKRLLIPVWTFLTIFFIIFYFAFKIGLINYYPFTTNKIINSYFLNGGIGFVWIFKVYIILAIITPLALKIKSKNLSKSKYFGILIITYIIYELVFYMLKPFLGSTFQEFLNTFFYVFIAYSILYFYGFKLASITDKQILIISLIAFFIFLVLFLYNYNLQGKIVMTQDFKYPPRLYYLSYSLCALNFLYLFIKRLTIKNKTIYEIIVWLSSNSLWIYLWHIMGFYLWEEVFNISIGGFLRFSLNASFIFSFGIVLTMIQLYLINKFISIENKFGKNIHAVFT